MTDLQPLNGKIWTKPFKVLTVLAVIGLVLILKRFIFGLGSVTNLNDGYPWGLWIVYDVVTGTAFACGGYAMAILVYIFNRGEYHPLVRSSLLVSMFGYTLAIISIYIDVGRWWQLHNVFLPQYYNPNSVMFEVALCVSLYVVVLWIEFSPAIFEGLRNEKTMRIINRFMFFFIALGVLLPTLHQSSLGSLMIVAGEKLSPLFQTLFLPLLFLITAISLGYAMVIFESIFASVNLKRPLETPLLSKISGYIPWLLLLFLIIRFGDIIFRGQFASIFAFDVASVLFLVETILFVVPMVILFNQQNRDMASKLFMASLLIVLAGGLYRFDTFIVVFNPGHGYHYFPAFQEFMITIGIIAMEIMGYLYMVKKLPVMPAIKNA
ncbi:MAG: Ni/Fe-hydrogenase cytochrome b subunit [Caldithrix sp.]|nr:Ni/Fe-hydrogenase cytochrome b subunit [Caldithrix sp.]